MGSVIRVFDSFEGTNQPTRDAATAGIQMQKYRHGLSCFAAFLGLLVWTSTASATVLTPGTTVAPINTQTSPILDVLANTGLRSVTINNGNGTSTTYNYDEEVVQYTGSGVSFIYQVSMPTLTPVGQPNAGTPNVGDIARITGSSFAGFLVDVEQNQNGPLGAGNAGNFALSANRSSIAADGGGTVGFNLTSVSADNSVTAGLTSWLFIVNTNAQNWTTGTISLIDSQTLQDNNAFAPAAGTNPNFQAPEPSSMVLCASCFLSLGGGATVLRRRRNGDRQSSAT
jgi:hypothetical protein